LKIAAGEIAPALYVGGVPVSIGQVTETSPLSQQAAPEKISEQEALQRKVKNGRSSFLTMIALTAVNIVLILINADVSFPFSASLPQFFVMFGQGLFTESNATMGYSISIFISLLTVGVYLLLFYLSAKHIGAMIAAIVLFLIDTFLLAVIAFYLNALSSFVIDFIFHAWVIWSMGSMLAAKRRLDALVRSSVE
jgi:hypothetical protein